MPNSKIHSRMFGALSAASEAILRTTAEPELLQRVCDAAFASGQFLFVAAFRLEEGSILRLAASAGVDLESARPLKLAQDYAGRGEGISSLAARTGQFVLGRLPAAVATRNRGSAVGRAAGDFIKLHLSGKAVIQSNHRHSEMQQIGNDRKQCGFLTAMLGSRGSKGAADLAVQGALGPQAAGLIEEVRHL